MRQEPESTMEREIRNYLISAQSNMKLHKYTENTNCVIIVQEDTIFSPDCTHWDIYSVRQILGTLSLSLPDVVS